MVVVMPSRGGPPEAVRAADGITLGWRRSSRSWTRPPVPQCWPARIWCGCLPGQRRPGGLGRPGYRGFPVSSRPSRRSGYRRSSPPTRGSDRPRRLTGEPHPLAINDARSGRAADPGPAPLRAAARAAAGPASGLWPAATVRCWVRQVTTCPQCGGRGRVIDQPCPACAASGRSVREETVTIRIPPGVHEGATLRLTGRGLPSPMPGDPPGDAYVSIRTRADLRFTRSGADLWHDLHIQAPDAVLGVTAAVPVPGGQAPVRVRVPPGTQPGSVLRVAGKGLPRYGGHGRGSLNLTRTRRSPLHCEQAATVTAAQPRQPQIEGPAVPAG